MNSRVIVALIGFIVCQTSADYQEGEWQEPDAWERHSPSVVKPNICPVCDETGESMLATVYYKKLIHNLFNKNTLKIDQQTGQLQTVVAFSLSLAQLEIIESSVHLRDIDAVVTKILGSATSPKCTCQAKGIDKGGGFIWLVTDIIKDVVKLFQMALSVSEVRFMCVLFGVLLLIWFIHIRYNRNIIAVVTIGLFLFGYIFTYLECNRKLDAEEMISLIKENEPEPTGWFRNAFNSIFATSKQDEQILNVKKKTKINLPFCRPDHVLMMYANEMFLNQFQLVIEKCMEMTMSFKNSLSFPYNVIAMISLPLLFFSIIKLVFENVLNPMVWFRAMRGDNTSLQRQQQLDSNEDRISGSNLKMLLEKFCESKPNEFDSSGVQDILECLEDALSKKTLDTCSSDYDLKSNNNVTICDIVENGKAEEVH